MTRFQRYLGDVWISSRVGSPERITLIFHALGSTSNYDNKREGSRVHKVENTAGPFTLRSSNVSHCGI